MSQTGAPRRRRSSPPQPNCVRWPSSPPHPIAIPPVPRSALTISGPGESLRYPLHDLGINGLRCNCATASTGGAFSSASVQPDQHQIMTATGNATRAPRWQASTSPKGLDLRLSCAGDLLLFGRARGAPRASRTSRLLAAWRLGHSQVAKGDAFKPTAGHGTLSVMYLTLPQGAGITSVLSTDPVGIVDAAQVHDLVGGDLRAAGGQL
jgi:hypothetical protein